MRLLGGVQLPQKPARATIRLPLSVLLEAVRPSAIPPHNAAHHAPARKIAFDDILRVAGRVHALVRPPMSEAAKLPRSRGLAFRRF